MAGEEVIVLGAGFSFALSSLLPLTVELGSRARKRAGLDRDDDLPNGWTFESWLSRLAEDQPDLSVAENLENRSRFARLADAIAEELLECESQISQQDAPTWLARLVAVLHATRATVITFNYDTQIEAAAGRHLLTDWQTGHRVMAADLVGHLPPPPPGASGFFSPIVNNSFEMLKLHGSLDWWWSPGDQTGATMARWSSTSTLVSLQNQEDASRRRLLPGRSRFIVPPTATKSSYYNNPFTRELWQRAGAWLHAARQVALVGYSLPLTDLVVAGMLTQRVSRSAELSIINIDSEAVRKRLEQLGFGSEQISEIGGPQCVAELVDQLEASANQKLVETLTALAQSENPMCIAWSMDRRLP